MDFSTLDQTDTFGIPVAPDTTSLPLPGSMPGVPSAVNTSWDGSTSVALGSQDPNASNVWDFLSQVVQSAQSVGTQIQGSPTPGIPPARRPVVTAAGSAQTVTGLFSTNMLLAIGVGVGVIALLIHVM